MQATSEQELKELLDEGKITQEEYAQLLGAIHQKEKPGKAVDVPAVPKVRRGFGRAALILMISGYLLPPVLLAVVAMFGQVFGWGEVLFVCLPIIIPVELLAFIFGIIGWKSPAGKAVAIGVPAIALCAFVVGIFVLPVMFYKLSRVKQQRPQGIESVRTYPLDSMEGVLTQDDVVFDPEISSDGKGSLRIHANRMDKTVFRLFETGPVSVGDGMLIYSAKVRAEGVAGKAYLEMWCDIPGKGEFFSRGLDQPVVGTTEWTTVQTPFRLESGQMPTNVKLNLVVEGTGIVWIDDIKLMSSPFN